jgi:hypothetical protein
MPFAYQFQAFREPPEKYFVMPYFLERVAYDRRFDPVSRDYNISIRIIAL